MNSNFNMHINAQHAPLHASQTPVCKPDRAIAKLRVRRSSAMHAISTIVTLACALPQLASAAEEAVSVTPYRPSVSTPAALSAPGWVEFEAGGQRIRAGDSSQRVSLPYTLKLAFTPDWGVRFGGEAWVRQTDDMGQRISGAGDSSIVVKRRFAIDDASAFGLEGGATLPTGRKGISADKASYSVNGIYSADIGSLHTDVNLLGTRVGIADAGVSRLQWLWAASLSKALNDDWGVVGELSGTQQRGADSSSQFLFAASYNLSKSMTLDAGFSRSLKSGTPEWSVFSGVTLLLGRLF